MNNPPWCPATWLRLPDVSGASARHTLVGMRIDVWSDLVCPFCHVGRRYLDLALADFPHRDEVDVVWHSFELDRNAPPVLDGSNTARVADKYGVPVAQVEEQQRQMANAAAQVGLDFQWEQVQGGNTYDAHRVIHFARSKDLEEPVTRSLMHGWYTDGEALGEKSTLVRLGVAGGLDEAELRAVLDSDDFGYDVREDEAMATEIGISSVPTFVLDQKYAVVGAQPVEVFRNALAQVWEERGIEPQQREAGCGACGCGAGGCGS